ncbi:hypothetical protein MYCTH_48078 [Thermothelomyces thermophilus ATCC 42464]|uniref:Copper homeostasis protein cutC homolog n=1 Tax=Thermothelomyces thermophilus (strain ATCC 42464 / BCRC 31852 / DSM 1799) TaxID=573729 RepID=G2Q8W3_THET4|nr:uncharacterized protein MYCTH_48078 [Thermothelomyces thermophilus ATCC 42464]AEO56308.1 hypothetical protein MYCTH_48078 [Thermothelomyces thermophilus ATCC 42464]
MALDKAYPRLEVPIFGPDDGLLAVSLGARRLELNRAGSYALGGTTPTLSELAALLSSLGASDRRPRPAIRIMIRPRGPPKSATSTIIPNNTAIITTDDTGGDQASDRAPEPTTTPRQRPDQDFLYTPSELAAMAASIRAFAASGLLSPRHGDGFVFGALRLGDDGRRLELDVERNRELVSLGEGEGERPPSPRLACVLHRAVDDLLSSSSCLGGDDDNIEGVMRSVRECGFDGVLTSGGRGPALGNLEGLKGVIGSGAAAAAEAKGLEVIVGGGVRRGNLDALVHGLKRGTGNDALGEMVWFHSSCLGPDGRLDEQEARALAEQLWRSGVVLTDY